jgi:sigma-B regulation protein RsbU (phosphoserine phosphatase)
MLIDSDNIRILNDLSNASYGDKNYMSEIFQRLLQPVKIRLSRRIVFWVFVSVIVIEAIILIPSFRNREKELLSHLREVQSAKIFWMLQQSPSDVTDKGLLNQFKLLLDDPKISGGLLLRSNRKEIGYFGERPRFFPTKDNPAGLFYRKSKNGERCDLVYGPAQLHRNYILILGHDAAPVRRELHAFILRIAGLVVIISVFVTVGAWLALNPIVVKPILRLRRDLIKAGEAISQDQKTTEFYSAPIQRQDELGEVIAAFRQMYKQISDAIDRRKLAEFALQKSFKEIEAYSKALKNELEKGRQMQANFLPARLITKAGWEFAAYFKPARQVAGDFYDLFELPDQAVGLVIADVCDKGVGAALFMALFRSLIRIFSGQTALEGLTCLLGAEPLDGEKAAAGVTLTNPQHFTALQAVSFTNRYVAQNHGELAMFATLFFGVLDPTGGILTYINGGHEPLLIVDQCGEVKQRLNPTGPAVGINPDENFQIMETRMEPGDLLLGYTDGVVEARSVDDRFFGMQKLLSLLENHGSSAAELLRQIAEAVKIHTEDAEQFDDITLLAIQRQLQSNK